MDDRQAIVDVLCEAAWIFDHKQWERMAEVFTPDSVAYGRRGLAAIRRIASRVCTPMVGIGGLELVAEP
jgi:hypothetical protein